MTMGEPAPMRQTTCGLDAEEKWESAQVVPNETYFHLALEEALAWRPSMPVPTSLVPDSTHALWSESELMVRAVTVFGVVQGVGGQTCSIVGAAGSTMPVNTPLKR